jgi:hypothetical protein
MVATGACFAPSADAAADALDRLIAACSLDETLLTVAEPSRARWCMARRDGEVIPSWLGDDAFEYSVQFAADDPRKLGTALTGSTGLPSSSGGLTVPFTVPYSINSTVVSGQVSLFNPGNETGPVTMRIDGPITGPVITHVGSGLQLVFSASLVLGVGEFLDINMDDFPHDGMQAHTVMAQGQSSRANWITSRGWSGFEPGPNTWAFTAVSGASALLTVTAVTADQ